MQCSGANNLFDWSTKKCSVCDITSEYYDEATHKCKKFNNDRLTNLSAPNLVNSGMPSTYWEYLNKDIKSKNSSATACPTDKPYYTGKECVNCTGDTPYFNL